MNQNIINSIENLKHYTNSNKLAFQSAKSPTRYKLNLEEKWSTEIHGVWDSLWEDDTLLYICNNLPYIQDMKPHVFADTLDNLVISEVLQPFLLFVDNKFVKWSNIIIMADCKFSYIKIKDVPYIDSTVECVVLPLNIYYKENATLSNITPKSYFIFDSNDKYIESPSDLDERYTVISFGDRDDLFYESFTLTEGKRQSSTLDTKYKLDTDNIILFKDGLIYDGNIVIHGLNVFSVDDNIFSSNIIAKIFYFIRGNESKDNIQFISNKTYLRNKILNGANDSYISQLNNPFDFLFHNIWNYDQNITHALQCIMMYNSSLVDDVYQNNSNILSKTYTGKYFNSIKDKFGDITLSRKIGDSFNNYPIIFKNGELYNYNFRIEYKNKDFKFPFIGVDSDIFEILYCMNIDNRIFNIRLDSNNNIDNTYYVNNVMENENIKIFSEDLPSSLFRISRSNNIQFEIETDFEKIDKNHIRIVPKDPFYLDKRISLVSRKQFHHYYKRIRENSVAVVLPEEFNYCNNPDNYLIFINHRKIDREAYKVTIPKDTRPFDDMTIFLNSELTENDEFEVFYLGYDMSEQTTSSTIPIDGNIVLDRSKLGYDINKYLYLFFINGKKINISDINNIDSNRIRIINNQKSIKNLCIIKHISDEEELKSLFELNQDQITNIMNSISDAERNNLFDMKSSLTNSETDSKINEGNMKSIVYELVRKYWMRPGNLQNDSPFVYDFEDADLLSTDPALNRLTPIDGNTEDYIKNDNINK